MNQHERVYIHTQTTFKQTNFHGEKQARTRTGATAASQRMNERYRTRCCNNRKLFVKHTTNRMAFLELCGWRAG